MMARWSVRLVSKTGLADRSVKSRKHLWQQLRNHPPRRSPSVHRKTTSRENASFTSRRLLFVKKLGVLSHRNFKRCPGIVVTFLRFDCDNVVGFHIGKGRILSSLGHFRVACDGDGVFSLLTVDDRHGRIRNSSDSAADGRCIRLLFFVLLRFLGRLSRILRDRKSTRLNSSHGY